MCRHWPGISQVDTLLAISLQGSISQERKKKEKERKEWPRIYGTKAKQGRGGGRERLAWLLNPEKWSFRKLKGIKETKSSICEGKVSKYSQKGVPRSRQSAYYFTQLSISERTQKGEDTQSEMRRGGRMRRKLKRESSNAKANFFWERTSGRERRRSCWETANKRKGRRKGKDRVRKAAVDAAAVGYQPSKDFPTRQRSRFWETARHLGLGSLPRRLVSWVRFPRRPTQPSSYCLKGGRREEFQGRTR